MRAIVVGLGLALFASAALGQTEHYVRGYTKSDGTYVAPHMQTNPNGTRNDNWSTRGNVNPYTGQEGTKPADPYGYQPYRPTPSRTYGQPTAPARGSSYGTPEPQGESPN